MWHILLCTAFVKQASSSPFTDAVEFLTTNNWAYPDQKCPQPDGPLFNQLMGGHGVPYPQFDDVDEYFDDTFGIIPGSPGNAAGRDSGVRTRPQWRWNDRKGQICFPDAVDFYWGSQLRNNFADELSFEKNGRRGILAHTLESMNFKEYRSVLNSLKRFDMGNDGCLSRAEYIIMLAQLREVRLAQDVAKAFGVPACKYTQQDIASCQKSLKKTLFNYPFQHEFSGPNSEDDVTQEDARDDFYEEMTQWLFETNTQDEDMNALLDKFGSGPCGPKAGGSDTYCKHDEFEDNNLPASFWFALVNWNVRFAGCLSNRIPDHIRIDSGKTYQVSDGEEFWANIFPQYLEEGESDMSLQTFCRMQTNALRVGKSFAATEQKARRKSQIPADFSLHSFEELRDEQVESDDKIRRTYSNVCTVS